MPRDRGSGGNAGMSEAAESVSRKSPPMAATHFRPASIAVCNDDVGEARSKSISIVRKACSAKVRAAIINLIAESNKRAAQVENSN
jgi:hypothetical protein